MTSLGSSRRRVRRSSRDDFSSTIHEDLVDEDRSLTIPVPRVFIPLLQPARYKGARGGRGSGKSHFYAENLLRMAVNLYVDSGGREGLRWACVREIQKSLEQSAMRLVRDKIIAFGLDHLFEVKQDRILTPGKDGIISFVGMQNHNADSIKSFEGYHGAWVEESQSFSAYSLSILRPTIRRDPSKWFTGSELWFSWNTTNPSDPVDDFFFGADRPPDSVVVEAQWYDNPYFPEVLRKEKDYDLRRDPDRYAHVWLGKYRKLSQARVFRNWRIEEFETPSDARLYFGADWGFSIDPTVLVRMWIDEGNRRINIDHEAYEVGCEIDRTPALFDVVPGSRIWPITADSARPETISYLKNRGFYINSAKKGADSVKDGIEFLKSYDIVVHPRCRHAIDELTHYSWRVDKRTGNVLPILEDRKNHVIDSVRYALEGARKSVEMTDVL